MFPKKLLEMRRIEKNFSGVKALEKVDFDLYPGEVHCLVGENGAGKSTLIKIISGVYKPDFGQIFIYREEVQINSPHFALQLGISTVYQDIDLIPTLTIAENIFLGEEIITSCGLVDNRKMEKKSKSLLSDLEVKLDPKQLIQDLGVNHRQFVAIAKALYRKSRIIIMDEPSAVLGLKEMEVLYDTIRRLRKNGIGIIYISHRLDEVFKIGDRVTVLRDGKLIKTSNVEGMGIPKLIKYILGRSLKNQYIKETPKIGNPIFLVRGLNRKGTLSDVSFHLNESEIVGICGLVGSGKTELTRTIVGIDPKDSGDIFINGQKVNIKSPASAVELGIGLIPEDRKEQGVVLCRSVGENIYLPLLRKIALFGIVNLRTQENLVKEYISKLNIKTPSPQQLVQNLSGGNQQKVVLAKWLASKCKILIFNEPTKGIDVGAKREIYYFMNNLVKEGVSIIMISSEIPEILALSDRILIMSEGRIVRELLAQEATQEKILETMSQRETEIVSVE
jgi:ribose transport system ATP-binding protein